MLLKKKHVSPCLIWCRILWVCSKWFGTCLHALQEGPAHNPWRNGRFRVLVGMQCASLYCVTFWGSSADCSDVSRVSRTTKQFKEGTCRMPWNAFKFLGRLSGFDSPQSLVLMPNDGLCSPATVGEATKRNPGAFTKRNVWICLERGWTEKQGPCLIYTFGYIWLHYRKVSNQRGDALENFPLFGICILHHLT